MGSKVWVFLLKLTNFPPISGPTTATLKIKFALLHALVQVYCEKISLL